MALTVAMAKVIIGKVIEKTEKSIARETNHLKELADDSTTLEAIVAMEAAGDPFPVDSPYLDYAEWKAQIQKEIKSTESTMERIGVEKAELMAFKHYLDTAVEV